ncbi:unnamed protein product [Ranitomeya imitator]|uniref:G-protein coupled receptors family 3 profile domain-containing protein n=1 Tax=Ranitomeya imitator TaxID=111125 RepID=A0ABN9MKJ3_9NEOB|nr:unnamed protein product [Ranitomeya imitator]
MLLVLLECATGSFSLKVGQSANIFRSALQIIEGTCTDNRHYSITEIQFKTDTRRNEGPARKLTNYEEKGRHESHVGNGEYFWPTGEHIDNHQTIFIPSRLRQRSVQCIKCPWDQWPNDEQSRCRAKSIEFFSFEDDLGKILAATSIMSSSVPLFILRLFFYYKQSPIVKANNFSVSCLLLLSLTFCFLCSIVFIGYPQLEKCIFRQAAFSIAFTLCVSSVLSKTIMVVFAFRATRPGSNFKKWTSPRVPFFIILVCLLLQLILCVACLSTFPPFPQYNTQSKPGVIIVECNEGSSFTLWIMLGYLFLLATISFIVAFLARRLPDSFNEAQFITFSMLAFLSVWISFIPASLSAQGPSVTSRVTSRLVIGRVSGHMGGRAANHKPRRHPRRHRRSWKADSKEGRFPVSTRARQRDNKN